jgi:hypothetical protein
VRRNTQHTKHTHAFSESGGEEGTSACIRGGGVRSTISYYIVVSHKQLGIHIAWSGSFLHNNNNTKKKEERTEERRRSTSMDNGAQAFTLLGVALHNSNNTKKKELKEEEETHRWTMACKRESVQCILPREKPFFFFFFVFFFFFFCE